MIVPEDDFSKDRILREIDLLFDDKKIYQNMKEASKKLGIPDSATRIYQEVKRIIR